MLGIYDRPDDAGFSLARSSDDRPELSTPPNPSIQSVHSFPHSTTHCITTAFTIDVLHRFGSKIKVGTFLRVHRKFVCA